MSKIAKRRYNGLAPAATPSASGVHKVLGQVAGIVLRITAENRRLRRDLAAVDKALASVRTKTD